MKWNFCEDHEYSEYQSETFGRTVCFTCDPESGNNAHRPSAQKAVLDALKAERRRLEDRIRKDPEALQRALKAVFNR